MTIQTPQNPTSVSVAGAGVAQLPVPRWAKLLKAVIHLALFAAILSGGFAFDGWRWVMSGLTPEIATWIATLVTAATALCLILARSGALNRLLNIKKINDLPEWVYGGQRGVGPLFATLALAAALVALVVQLVLYSARINPLPGSLARTTRDIAQPESSEGQSGEYNDNLSPVYFWDYATWVSPSWFEQIHLVLPYEKGPPRKLLPKIFFADSRTHTALLELHGKRPRTYSESEVLALFDSKAAAPADWPLLWKLEKEAGLATEGVAVPVLHLMHFRNGDDVTRAIGTPPEPAASTRVGADGSGRFFFWGPDGSVFQVKCPRPCPAELTRMLELVRFPADPRGSFQKRLEWTRERIKNLLSEGLVAPEARRRQEGLLTLYLLSLLTLDPRDPEAFFHIGKLAHDRDTVLAAARYGRDLGMEEAKILELESTADRMDRR